jgi:glycine/D-amino acid oxidase-like deaminating enzyme
MDLTSGYPFWPIRHGLIRAYPRLATNAVTDVAIIGGGITGALVAYHLADAGIDCIVLDRRDIGWGSTAATTALLQYELDTLLVDLAKQLGESHATRAYLACRDAIGRMEVLIARTGNHCGYQRKKSLYLATRRRDVKLLHREREMRRAIGIHVDWLDEEDLGERFFFKRPGALLSYDAGQLDAYEFTHTLFAESMRRGIRVFDRTNVKKIATADGITLETDEGCTVRAKHLVFASGYETQEFLGKKIARLHSTYAVVSEPTRALPGWAEDQCLIWEHSRPYLYMRTTDDGRVIVGGEDEPFRNPRRRDRLIPAKARTLAKKFSALFPEIEFRPAFAWAGTFGETPDSLAYIGEHPDWPRCSFALGYGGNGITYSILAAEIIRDNLLARPNPNANLFRFNR